MLEAELQQLRDDNTVIADLLTELETHLALPLPLEPPFPVMSDVTALQDRVYAMARRVGNMKRMIRDRILQQTLAADFAQQEEKIEALGQYHCMSGRSLFAGVAMVTRPPA
ncbi:MAG: hypothetical protein ABW003_14095 [Microvirga sp.]